MFKITLIELPQTFRAELHSILDLQR